MTDWSIWVLDHGLPEMPETVAVGESVPVARWSGPRFASVLHVQWSWSDAHDEDELVSEIELFWRADDHWEVFSGSGGSGWFDPPLSRPAMPPKWASVLGGTGASEQGRSCCAAEGLAGVDAAAVEVEDADGVTRQVLESPIGAFVVASDGSRPATIRVLDKEGTALLHETFGGTFAE